MAARFQGEPMKQPSVEEGRWGMNGPKLRLPVQGPVRGETGQGLVEYALIILFIALAVIMALTILGPKIGNIFNTAGNSLG